MAKKTAAERLRLAPEGEPATSDTPKPEREKIERLSIPLDDSGRPMFDRMRDSTRAKLADMLRDPSVQKSLGADGAPVTAGADTTQFTQMATLMLVRSLSQVNVMIVARLTGAPASLAAMHGAYTPEEQRQIADPLEAVLNKYSPGLLGKYGEELALAGALVMVTMTKAQAVRDVMAMSRPMTPAKPEGESIQ